MTSIEDINEDINLNKDEKQVVSKKRVTDLG
jgi:hypothetical protein